jgi:translocation and assembly module TamB
MRRTLRIFAWIIGILIAVPVVALALLLVAANVAPGQRAIAGLAGRLTGGMVAIEDLSGRFPDRPRIGRIAVRDAKGEWLSATDVALDWAPLALLQRQAWVRNFSAATLHVTRLPESSGGSSSSGSFSLPVTVKLDALHLAQITLDAPVAGTPAQLSVQGSATLESLQQGSAQLAVDRLDGAGTYRLDGSITPDHLTAQLHLAEPPGGLVGSVANLPALGAITADATLDGPRNAAALQLTLAAGELHATADGTLNLVDRAADLHVTGNAPAMAPRPDLAWQSVALDARVHGPWTAPAATGFVRLAGLAAGGATIQNASFDLSGDAGGQLALRGTLEALRIPGPQPDLLAGAPLQLTATANFGAATRPVSFTLNHQLLALHGDAVLEPALSGHAQLDLSDLAPFAALGGVAVQGHASLTAQASTAGDTTSLVADGSLAITGGQAPLPALIGPDGKLHLAASLHGSDVAIQQARIEGKTVNATVSGTDNGGTLALDFQAALTDLAALQPNLAGQLTTHGNVAGQPTGLAVNAELDGTVAAAGHDSGPLHASLHADGVPNAPSVTLTADGALAGAPLTLAASVKRGSDGAITSRVDHADWQSAHAEAAIDLAAGATMPTGHLALRMDKLDQLAILLGTPITGSLSAQMDLPPGDAQTATVQVTGRALGVPGNRIGQLTLDGKLTDATTQPKVALHASASGIEAGGAGGSAQVNMTGPRDALAVQVTADMHDPSGTPATIRAAATLDSVARNLALTSLQADWHGLAARLLRPAHFALANGVAVDQLGLGVGAATLQIAGKLSPTLDATLALHGVTPDLATPFVPNLVADGRLTLDAKLSGNPSRPDGQLHLAATGLHMRSGPGSALPPATIDAQVALAGGVARIDGRATAGSSNLTLAGQAPLDPAGTLGLRAGGHIDLGLLDPILAANGRQVRGVVSLDATISGTQAAPRVDGSVQLAKGEVQDFTQGMRLTNITADLRAAGDEIRIASFTGHAGKGALDVVGSIGVLQPGLPIDLHVAARQAQLLASDRLTATIDADLALRGHVSGENDLSAAGKVTIDQAEIRIPERLPVSVVSLNVRRVGTPPPPPPTPGLTVALDVAVNAPNQIFVRGRGLEAVLRGQMHVGGTSAAPIPTGELDMDRGTFSVVGTTLTFTRGLVQFGGDSISDPMIDFVATTTNPTTTATLEISGTASNPKIKLSSMPELPQDEVLAQMLFSQSTQQLSPFQLAEIANALASFSGVGGGIGNPLENVRKALGLDRLSVGSDTSGTPTIEAGSYVASGVYVGAKQGVGIGGNKTANSTGNDTQATVQIDITKRLKLETDVGAGSGSNSVGLTYQFEY